MLQILGALAVAPLLAAQVVRVRRETPRLPGAAGPREGLVPGAGLVRLAVLGESTVDGVGAPTHEQGLAGQLAHALAGRGSSVAWQAVGRTGANAAVVRDQLVGQVRPADLVVVALGVNDTIELRAAASYRRDLLGVVVALRRRLGPVPVVLAGVPPMHRFTGLPRPLRDVLGARSAALDAAAATLTKVPGVAYVPMPPELLDTDTFAGDRFHPGPVGYARWAEQLAEAAFSLLSVNL